MKGDALGDERDRASNPGYAHDPLQISTDDFAGGYVVTHKKFLIGFLTLASLSSLGGCAARGVDVWERDVLAKPEMQFDFRANDQVIDDHIYFSKEASSGGRGFGGGGCGCN